MMRCKYCNAKLYENETHICNEEPVGFDDEFCPDCDRPVGGCVCRVEERKGSE